MSSPGADFTHAIIGGGAVGLAIARQLALRDERSTILIERNDGVGMETSSRNSEVIHAGLYYGKDSLKTKLCIKGKSMMYDLCSKHNIPHRITGKWLVAQSEDGLQALVNIHEFSRSIDGIPTRFIASREAAREEPHVRAKAGILESSTTGIVDSHAFMQYLLGSFEDRGGDVALNTTVTHITPLGNNGSCGWRIAARDRSSGNENTFIAENLINSAGLGACDICNMFLPPERHQTQYYAKGNYFSYSASTPKTNRLIYPAPEPGLAGLGTHLTLDIGGRIRFGPDVDWVDDPNDLSVNIGRLPTALEQIKRYLPGVDVNAIQPDYAGIRPKLRGEAAVVAGRGLADFVIRKEDGYEGFVNLLGIESPGLTSSLAIAEMVEDLLYR